MKKLYKSVKVKLNSNCITEIWTLCGYFVTWTRELTVLMASNSCFDWVARYISRMGWDASSVLFMGSLRYPKPLSGFLCSFSDGTYGLPLRSSALSKSCQSLTDWLANPPRSPLSSACREPPSLSFCSAPPAPGIWQASSCGPPPCVFPSLVESEKMITSGRSHVCIMWLGNFGQSAQVLSLVWNKSSLQPWRKGWFSFWGGVG